MPDKEENQLEKHVQELERFGFLTDDWFWHKDKVKLLHDLNQGILAELNFIHSKGRHVPDAFVKVMPLHRTLDKTLSEMLHLKVESAKRNYAEYTTQIILQIKKLLSEVNGTHLRIERLKQLQEWGFDIKRDSELTEFLINHWDGVVEMANASGSYAYNIFYFGLPAVKDLINERTWPDLVEMAKASGSNAEHLFHYGLPAVKDLINERTWPMLVKGLVEIAEASRHFAYNIFCWGLPAVKDLINERTWPDLVEMAKASGSNAVYIFQYGLPAVKQIINPNSFPELINYFIELLKYCKKNEGINFSSFNKLNHLFNKFGLSLFDDLIMPTAKSQTAVAYHCFGSFAIIFDEGRIQGKDDLAFLRYIVEKKSRRANDILTNFVLKGLKDGVISKPLSIEAFILKEFLENSPAYLIELYVEFKKIYLSKNPEKHLHYENLFKNVRKLKKEIIEGTLSSQYPENLVVGVLFSVFTPEISADKNQYLDVLKSSQDRQADIPHVLISLSGKWVRISQGGYVLKEELNVISWNNLVEAVRYVNSNRISVDPADVGINLLNDYRKGALRAKQKEYLVHIYSHSVSTGNSLPDFNTNHETLMKYKEFIGDRLRNDLIFSLLSKAQEKYPVQFNQLIGRKNLDYRNLAKMLLNLWNSKAANKEDTIKKILQKNGLSVQQLNWSQGINLDWINSWLNSLSTNVVDKSLVQKIFNDLYGEQYSHMQKEIGKFEFKREGRSLLGKPFRFVLSKRKMHCCAMFNFGVCVASDDKLWNMADFWQMIIFDEEDNACGGVIYRTIIEDGKAYLIASIQPSSNILSSVSPEGLYSKIIQFSRLMVKKLRYHNLLIPKDSSIHSNRGSMQSIIATANYPLIKLKKTYEFSYNPYNSYNEFFIAA